MPADFDEGSVLGGFDAILNERLPEILNSVGAYLTARSQQTFRDQAFDGEPWPPRTVPNVAGIVSDLNAGGQPKGRRFQPRPALIDTGGLRRSISWQVQGKSVIVGTTLPYASVHQVGGVTRPVPLTATGRQGLAQLLQRRPQLRDDLGWLFNRPLVFSRVPARPFVGLQSGDVDEITRIVTEAVTG